MSTTLNATDFLKDSTLENPYPLYKRLREEAPVWKIPGTKIVVVSSYDLINEATKRTEDFSSALSSVLYRKRNGTPGRIRHGKKNVGQMLATADQPLHTQHKAIIAPLFSPKRIAEMHADVGMVATDYINKALTKSQIEFMSEIANPIPMKVVSDVVGFPTEDINRLLQAAFDSTAIVGASLSFWELMRCIFRSAMIQFWMNKQFSMASSGGDNIMSRVKRNVEEGKLSKGAALGILHTFLAAGGESTTSLLGSAIRILAEDQVLQDRLRQSPDEIPNFIEEVLRVESPFRSHLRSVWRDTELGGVEIPAGSTVLLFWASGNHDPNMFPEPEKFDIDRPRRHMTFGRGIHMCIGAPLARLEAKIIIEKLLAKASKIEMDPERPPIWTPSMQVRRYERLPLLMAE